MAENNNSEKYVTAAQLKELGWKNMTPAKVTDLNNTLEKYNINTPVRIQHFLAQCAQETGKGQFLTEYGGKSYFVKLYKNRTDLGNNGTDADAVNYRGGGCIQLTGRYNYQKFANAVGDPRIMEGADYVAANYPWMAAGQWWDHNKMNHICDGLQQSDPAEAVAKVTRHVNGGRPSNPERAHKWDQSLANRIEYFNQASHTITNVHAQTQPQAPDQVQKQASPQTQERVRIESQNNEAINPISQQPGAVHPAPSADNTQPMAPTDRLGTHVDVMPTGVSHGSDSIGGKIVDAVEAIGDGINDMEQRVADKVKDLFAKYEGKTEEGVPNVGLPGTSSKADETKPSRDGDLVNPNRMKSPDIAEMIAKYGRQAVEGVPFIAEEMAAKMAANPVNANRIEEIKNTVQAISDLPRNPDSKSLLNAYAKAEFDKNGQTWTADSNKNVVESMLKDGRTPQRIVEALKHSPDPVDNAYYFVKDIQNSPEMQQAKSLTSRQGVSR